MASAGTALIEELASTLALALNRVREEGGKRSYDLACTTFFLQFAAEGDGMVTVEIGGAGLDAEQRPFAHARLRLLGWTPSPTVNKTPVWMRSASSADACQATALSVCESLVSVAGVPINVLAADLGVAATPPTSKTVALFDPPPGNDAVLDDVGRDAVLRSYRAFALESREQVDRDEPPDPASSDVTPLKLAVVDALDDTAVLDVLAVIPRSSRALDLTVFRLTATGWIQDSLIEGWVLGTSPDWQYPFGRLRYIDKQMAEGVESQVMRASQRQSLDADVVPPLQGGEIRLVDDGSSFNSVHDARCALPLLRAIREIVADCGSDRFLHSGPWRGVLNECAGMLNGLMSLQVVEAIPRPGADGDAGNLDDLIWQLEEHVAGRNTGRSWYRDHPRPR